MVDDKVITLHDKIPKLREQRKQKANRRLIFFLSFFFFLILIIVYFQSPLSHIKSIVVTGNNNVSSEVILKASRISTGTSIWSINKNDIASEILKLPEIQTVEIQRKLPNQIELVVSEHERIAYLYNEGKYFPILDTGEFLSELPAQELPIDAPILKDWEPGSTVSELATELIQLPEGILNRISEIYYTPTENNPLRVTVYMNDGYEVHSTIRNFSAKMTPYPVVIKELDPEKKGIIHLRMTPYFEEITEQIEEEEEGESER